jgi:hypothetical protein
MKQINIACPGNKLDIAYSVSVKKFFAQRILHIRVLNAKGRKEGRWVSRVERVA